MDYTTEKLPNEPITIWTPHAGFRWDLAELQELNKNIIALWDSSPEAVYHIVDLSPIKMNVEDMSAGAAAVAFGNQALWSHPKLKMVIVVTEDLGVQMGLRNVVHSAQTGGVYKTTDSILVMDSREKALDYIREQRHIQGS